MDDLRLQYLKMMFRLKHGESQPNDYVTWSRGNCHFCHTIKEAMQYIEQHDVDVTRGLELFRPYPDAQPYDD